MFNASFLSVANANKPKWKVSVGIDNEQEVYVPHFLFCDDEEHALMMASYEGVTTLFFEAHPFFPVSWLLKSIVKDKEFVEQLRQVRDTILKRNDEMFDAS